MRGMKARQFMPSPAPETTPRTAGRQEVRIIGGAWRHRKLKFADAPGLRPTPDRVRETLFNWLGQTLHGQSVLDCFAGSGALGFEAASRGAARVLMLESHPGSVRQLKANQALLGADACRIQQIDAISFLATSREQFDLMLLDPPYASNLLTRALDLAARHLTADGQIYAESDKPVVHSQFVAVRQSRAGAVHFALLEPVTLATERTEQR